MKLKTKEAAAYLRVSAYYLRNLRQSMHNFGGPPFTYGAGIKGVSCLYDTADLDKWLETHKFRSARTQLKVAA